MPKPHFIDYEHNEFVERHQDKIAGVVGCYDRLIIKETLGIWREKHANHRRYTSARTGDAT